MALNLDQLAALKAKLQDGTVQNVGDVFNDNTHSTFAPKPIRELKFAPRISEKLIFPLLMAFPFHPLEGRETPEFNSLRKYSAMVSPTDMMALIKMECEINSDLKRFYMKQAQFKGQWDTTDPTVVDSTEDKIILWRYRRRMTYSFPAIRIHAQGISGDKFSNTYLLNSKQDPITGEFVGELSLMHQAGSLIGALCRREIASFNEGVETKNPNTISQQVRRPFALPSDYLASIPNVDSMEAKDRRGQIRKCYPLSSPSPLLATVGLSFSLTPITGTTTQQVGSNKYELYDHFADEIQFKKHLFFTVNYGAIQAIDSVVGNYYPKDPKKYTERNAEVDLYADFCALDFITEDTKTKFTQEEKMEAARKMSYITEKKPLYIIENGSWAFAGLDKFAARIGGFFAFSLAEDMVSAIQNLLIKSYKPVTEVMERAAALEIQTKFPLTSPLYSPEIKTAFTDLLFEIFPDDMTAESYKLKDSGVDAKGAELYEELLRNESAAISDGVVIDEKVSDHDADNLIVDALVDLDEDDDVM